MKRFLNGGFLFASAFNYFLLVIVSYALTEEWQVSFPLAIVALVILYALALTPIVDWYYRMILNLREPNAIEGERLKRVWKMVCSGAEKEGIHVKESIKLYISDEEGLIAFATGTRTIVVERELLNNYIGDEEIAGVLAHELAHHIHGDTIRLLMSMQGTVIFGGIRFVIKIVFWIVSKFMAAIVAFIGFAASDGNLDEGIGWWKIINYIMDKIYWVIDFFLTRIAYLETMCFRFFDRQQEFAADAFGGRIGFSSGIATFLRKLPKEEKVDKFSIEYLLYGTHPPIEERIARLQEVSYKAEIKEAQFSISNEDIVEQVIADKNLEETFSIEDYLLHPENYSEEELYRMGIFCLSHDREQEGIEWLERAVEHGEARAYTELGCCYMRGLGVTADKKTAINYLKKAFAHNEPQGTYILGECYDACAKEDKDFAVAAKIYGKAAKLGERRAQAKLGQYFLDGVGVEKNEEVAFKWLCKAVEEGDYRFAGYSLARCYLEGIGTESNLKKGLSILKKVIDRDGNDVERAKELLAEYGKDILNDNVVMG